MIVADPLPATVASPSPVSAVFQPPKSQSTLSGKSMRSLANFRLSECQPRPRLGSSRANLVARFDQSRANERLIHANGSFGAGITGAFPVPGLRLRASSRNGSRRGRDSTPPMDSPGIEVDVRPLELTDRPSRAARWDTATLLEDSGRKWTGYSGRGSIP